MTLKRSAIAKAIKDEILAGRWLPGARLTERSLCDFTKASRSSVREALQQLQQEGLVENRPNYGVRVAALDAQEAADIYQVRSVLEGLAAKNFINMATSVQRERLEQSLLLLEQAIDQGEVVAQLHAIEEFYAALLDGCYNNVLKSTLQELHTKISRLRATSIQSPGRTLNTLSEMKKIVDAVRANDEQAAWLACVEHMQNTAAVAIRMIAVLSQDGR